MAKKFGALLCEMSPAAPVRAAQRTKRMLPEMLLELLETYRAIVFASLTSPGPNAPRARVGKSVRRNSFDGGPHHGPTPNRCNLDS